MYLAREKWAKHREEVEGLTGAESPETPVECFHCDHEPMTGGDFLVLWSAGECYLSGACGCSILCYRVVDRESSSAAVLAGQDRA